MRLTLLSLCLLWCLSRQLPAQGVSFHTIFTGKDFAIAVPEPTGWHVTGTNAAAWDAITLVYSDSAALTTGVNLIRLSVWPDSSHDLSDNLAADQDQYRAKNPSIQFEPLATHNDSLTTLGSVFLVPKAGYEYVVYVAPAPCVLYLVSIAMHTGAAPASADALRAFQQVISALYMVGLKPN